MGVSRLLWVWYLLVVASGRVQGVEHVCRPGPAPQLVVVGEFYSFTACKSGVLTYTIYSKIKCFTKMLKTSNGFRGQFRYCQKFQHQEICITIDDKLYVPPVGIY